jgi:hypothetical protein
MMYPENQTLDGFGCVSLSGSDAGKVSSSPFSSFFVGLQGPLCVVGMFVVRRRVEFFGHYGFSDLDKSSNVRTTTPGACFRFRELMSGTRLAWFISMIFERRAKLRSRSRRCRRLVRRAARS